MSLEENTFSTWELDFDYLVYFGIKKKEEG